MPVTDCIMLDGKIYCYDGKNEQVIVFEIIALKECPKIVLEAFINNTG